MGLNQALGGIKGGELRALCVSLQPLFGKPPWKGMDHSSGGVEEHPRMGEMRLLCAWGQRDPGAGWWQRRAGITQGWWEHPPQLPVPPKFRCLTFESLSGLWMGLEQRDLCFVTFLEHNGRPGSDLNLSG